ncbi:MAG: SIR2 family protein [Thermodesulfobacteriota bacterium]
MNVRTVLLTGAGFSYDFGGFLRREMWEKLFNDRFLKENYPRINKLISEVPNYDYESIYSEVHANFCQEEGNAIDQVFLKLYKQLDESIRCVFWRHNAPRNVRELIDRFSREYGGGEYFFTLNQDLLIERLFFSDVHIPGFNAGNRISLIRDKEFSDEYTYVVPSDLSNQEPLSVPKLHYLKLHGSFNWRSSDGHSRMVIGKNKRSQIASEPLLGFYFNTFEKELSREYGRLLVIGYSFLDEHINEVIAKSDMELHIVDRFDFNSFKKELIEKKPYGKEIEQRIFKSYYYPYPLIDIFPQVATDSHAWRTIKESFFAKDNRDR